MTLIPALIYGYWSFDRIFGAHASLDSSANKAPTSPKSQAPSRHGVRNSINSYPGANIPVESLFCGCGPSAVGRFVVAIIVDPVKGMLNSRFAADVVKEVLKRSSPPVADGNPSSAIPLVPDCVWVVAPSVHTRPSQMFRCSAHSMCGVSGNQNIANKTATRFRLTFSKVVRRYLYRVPARAFTQPNNKTILAFGSFSYCGQFSKYLTRKVYGFRHCYLRWVIAIHNYTLNVLNAAKLMHLQQWITDTHEASK